MRSSFTAAIAAMAAIVAAVPAPQDVSFAASASNQGNTVERVARGSVLINGPADVAKTHAKYGKSVPQNVDLAASAVAASAATATQSGSVSASPESYNSAYLCPVQVGANSLLMDFDTGSSDLWVFSSRQPSSQTSGHAIYACGGTLQSGETWDISYGDGSGSAGVVYSDKVVIGGVTATSQAVEAATSASSSFVTGQSDGLVGLAFDDLNTCTPTTCATFVDNVVSSLPSPLFAAYLKRGTPGAYDFGYLNSSHYSGSITYTNVIDKSSYGYWTIAPAGYAIGSGSEVTSTSLNPSIVDTGTSLIYLPAAVVKAYYAKVSGSSNSATYGGYVYACSTTLPSLTIYIGSTPFTVPGSSMNYGPVTSSTCFGALQSSASLGINILGDAFINNFYVVFDFVSESATSQVGFAKQK